MNVRLLALAGVAVCAVALPLAVASAGQVGSGGPAALGAPAVSGEQVAPGDRAPSAGRVGEALLGTSGTAGAAPPGDAKAASPSPPHLGLGRATAARCGPELTSPEGIEAQTCVLTQGEETWARTYYRNTTGGALEAVLSLMGPAGRAVQMRCAVSADDEPGTCETPREPVRGGPQEYTAVAEFAASAEEPLLLRSGSNSSAPTSS
ncbi:hypothetical protein GA0115233_11416 [Streptomyces sp. DI166]|uniref:hypothetical protein n=1 Tax=Streptomyces sp. DI166 TaxID=1839783 RepID=UPI0007F521F9|nr:hypothetical protein [Streptomyces sp. DI166]SBT95514.1 hypothetical protein GA0115233_11416 [Streptomyces sp. DI166]